MIAIIWKKENCFICDKALKALEGHKLIESVIVKSMGDEEDRKVIAQFAKQKMIPPVVKIDDAFVLPQKIYSYLKEKGERND